MGAKGSKEQPGAKGFSNPGALNASGDGRRSRCTRVLRPPVTLLPACGIGSASRPFVAVAPSAPSLTLRCPASVQQAKRRGRSLPGPPPGHGRAHVQRGWWCLRVFRAACLAASGTAALFDSRSHWSSPLTPSVSPSLGPAHGLVCSPAAAGNGGAATAGHPGGERLHAGDARVRRHRGEKRPVLKVWVHGRRSQLARRAEPAADDPAVVPGRLLATAGHRGAAEPAGGHVPRARLQRAREVRHQHQLRLQGGEHAHPAVVGPSEKGAICSWSAGQPGCGRLPRDGLTIL